MPDHWHKTMPPMLVAAGKDVYVEKPVSHSIAEGAEMVRAIEASKQIVQTGTQQRSWDHWMLGKQMIDSGRLGQITFVHTYWYQHATAGKYAAGLDGTTRLEARLGPAPDQPFKPERFYPVAALLGLRRRRHHRSDDALDRCRRTGTWMSRRRSQRSTTGHNYNLKLWEHARYREHDARVSKNFMAAYLGTVHQPRRRRRARVPRRSRHAEDRSSAACLLSRRCGVGGRDVDARAGHLRAIEWRRNLDPPAELARLHPQPQTAEFTYPRRASGSADVSHRQRGTTGRSSGALESGG